jgi:hypothetical protein
MEWARRGHFKNHFKIKHKNVLVSDGHWQCCTESFADEDKCLEHVWEVHMELYSPHLPLPINPHTPHPPAGLISTSSLSPVFGPANPFRSSSTVAPPFMSSETMQSLAHASNSSSFGPHPSVVVPNDEDGSRTPVDIHWSNNPMSQDLDQPYAYDTVPADHYLPLEPDFATFNLAEYRS